VAISRHSVVDKRAPNRSRVLNGATNESGIGRKVGEKRATNRSRMLNRATNKSGIE
jgi:hypothetical protein